MALKSSETDNGCENYRPIANSIVLMGLPSVFGPNKHCSRGYRSLAGPQLKFNLKLSCESGRVFTLNPLLFFFFLQIKQCSMGCCCCRGRVDSCLSCQRGMRGLGDEGKGRWDAREVATHVGSPHRPELLVLDAGVGRSGSC